MGLTILYELILLLLRGSAEPGMQPAKCPSIRLKAKGTFAKFHTTETGFLLLGPISICRSTTTA